MMRILILGNSHAASIRRAFPAISAAFPQVQLDFWGLPGRAFGKARLDAEGILRPDPDDKLSLRKLTQWNIAPELDLRPYDRVFLIGLRHDHRDLLQFLRGHQPLDWGARANTRAISMGFLKDALEASSLRKLREQSARIPMDARFTLMPAPAPALCVSQAGPLQEPVIRAVSKLSTAAALYQLLQQQTQAAHLALGLRYVAQPPQTLAKPWLSDDAWLEEPGVDGRHMNADYGFLAFQALMKAADAPAS